MGAVGRCGDTMGGCKSLPCRDRGGLSIEKRYAPPGLGQLGQLVPPLAWPQVGLLLCPA